MGQVESWKTIDPAFLEARRRRPESVAAAEPITRMLSTDSEIAALTGLAFKEVKKIRALLLSAGLNLIFQWGGHAGPGTRQLHLPTIAPGATILPGAQPFDQ